MKTVGPHVRIGVGDRIRVTLAPTGSQAYRPVILTVRAVGKWNFDKVDLTCEADDPAFANPIHNHFHWSQFGPEGGCELLPPDPRPETD